MEALFASGKVVDLILLLMAAEAALLVVLHSRGRCGVPPLQLLSNLLAGAFLLLALRAALTGAPWTTCSMWLLLGLAGHVLDLAGRWRGSVRR